MTIRVESVVVSYVDGRGRACVALDVAQLEIPQGQHLCVVGASGSGKTTLLHCLAGITLPTQGRIIHGELDITALGEPARDRFRAANVGYVFQTFNLLRGLSCIENVELAATLCGRSSGDVRERAMRLLERVGLADRAHDTARRMSVGEQQRVAIARALMADPKVVLADEPTANLDERSSDAVLDLLAEITAEEGSTLVLVTHEARVRDRFDSVVELGELAA